MVPAALFSHMRGGQHLSNSHWEMFGIFSNAAFSYLCIFSLSSPFFSFQKPLQLSQLPGPVGFILGPTVAPKNVCREDQESQNLRAGRGLRNHLVQHSYLSCCQLEKREMCNRTSQFTIISHYESLSHEVVRIIFKAICSFKCIVSINLLPTGEDRVGTWFNSNTWPQAALWVPVSTMGEVCNMWWWSWTNVGSVWGAESKTSWPELGQPGHGCSNVFISW